MFTSYLRYLPYFPTSNNKWAGSKVRGFMCLLQ